LDLILSYFQIVRPVSALLIIDVQNDFISGSLAISNCVAGQDGEEVNNWDQNLLCVPFGLSNVPFKIWHYNINKVPI
jgi:hypothetical protein